MRIQSGKPMKNGGWLHNGKTDFKPYIPTVRREVKEEIDFISLWNRWKIASTPNSLIIFAEKLGIDPMALHLIGCAWSFNDNAWAFPMKYSDGSIIGIRLRTEAGQKYAVKGSRSGLFISDHPINQKENLYICEGPTDTAAALCMGLQAIGRPSCLGLEEMISYFITINKVKRCVILSDNDDAGLKGSSRLQERIKIASCVLTLPCKDVREFYTDGGTKQMMESSLKNLIWTKK